MKKGNLFLNIKSGKKNPEEKASEKKVSGKKKPRRPGKEKKIANSVFMVFAGAIVIIILLGTLSYRMASRAVMQKY